jgi:hypothetical protein
MKKFLIQKFLPLILILFSASTFQASAQRPFGNEWINYSQSYFKIKVVKSGLYRIQAASLSTAGADISAISPAGIQLYYRGKQVPVYIAGDQDGKLDNADYIIFYGQKNNGDLDSVVYYDGSQQANRFDALYSDTSAYFLTWDNSSTSNLRFKDYNKAYDGGATPDFYRETFTKSYGTNYYTGVPQNAEQNYILSEYKQDEGLAGDKITLGKTRSQLFKLPGMYNEDDAYLKFRILGISDNAQSPDHHLQVNVGPSTTSQRLGFEKTYDGFQRIEDSIALFGFDFGPNLNVSVKSAGISGVPTDVHAIAWFQMTYNRDFSFDQDSPRVFSFKDESADKTVRFKFFGGPLFSNPKLFLFDLTNNYITRASYKDGDAYFQLPGGGNLATYYLGDSLQTMNAGNISKVKFTKPDLAAGLNFIIITNKKLATGANNYAT